jgi:hypothetical protein
MEDPILTGGVTSFTMPGSHLCRCSDGHRRRSKGITRIVDENRRTPTAAVMSAVVIFLVIIKASAEESNLGEVSFLVGEPGLVPLGT